MLRFTPILLALIACATAHLCLLSPPQRGSMVGINKAGADDCFLVKGACGGRPAPANPSIILKGGSNFTVTFQKNLDHYNSSNPGYFGLSGGQSEDSLQELGRVPDNGEPSLSLYSMNLTIPGDYKGRAVFQVAYVSHKSGTSAQFVQCADLIIV